MSAIYDIIETFTGTPGDAYQSSLLYMACIILTFMMIFGIFDLFYAMVTGWWGK